jgi:hypothetical protein
MVPSESSGLSVGEIVAICVAVFTILSSLFSLAFLLGRYSVRMASVETRLDKFEEKEKECKSLILTKIEDLPCHNILCKLTERLHA